MLAPLLSQEFDKHRINFVLVMVKSSLVTSPYVSCNDLWHMTSLTTCDCPVTRLYCPWNYHPHREMLAVTMWHLPLSSCHAYLITLIHLAECKSLQNTARPQCDMSLLINRQRSSLNVLHNKTLWSVNCCTSELPVKIFTDSGKFTNVHAKNIHWCMQGPYIGL